MRDASKPSPELFRKNGHTPEAVYVYRAEAGDPVAAAARFAPGTLNSERKTYCLFRLEGSSWIAGIKGRKLPLYNLPDVRAQIETGGLVFVVEGEMCADRLASLGFVATTNACGGKWDAAHTETMRGANVAVLPDNDDPGRVHVQAVARELRGVAESVRLVDLPGLPVGGDVVDWLDAGGTRDALLDMVKAASEWTPWNTSGEEWQEPQPFGVDSEARTLTVTNVLPPRLAELAGAIANTVRVDAAAPAALIPVVLSCAAGNAYRVRVSPAHAEPNLARYLMWSAEPGERKSETFRRVVTPLDDWTEAATVEYRERKHVHDTDVTIYRERAKLAEKRAASAKAESEADRWQREAHEARASVPGPLRRPFAYLGDTTPPALVRMMAEQCGAFGVLAADARHVADALLGCHRRDGSTDDSVFLRAHGGDCIDRGRVGETTEGEILQIARPSLALGICLQPDKLAELADRSELISSGFLPRCNLVQPRSLRGERIETGRETPLDPVVAERWGLVVRSILDARFRIVDSDLGGQWKAVELALGAEAAELRRTFANELELRQRPDEDLRSVGAFASKAAGEAARLAGLLHLAVLADEGRVNEAGTVPIAAGTWMLAERHQRWQLAETLRVLRLAREDVRVKLGKRLLEWVAAKPGERQLLNTRDVIASRIVENATEATALLGWLAERGWTRQVPPAPGGHAARWEVHPTAFRRQSA